MKSLRKIVKIDKVEDWYWRHERHLSSGAFLFGFIVDNITLTRIDLLLDNFILLGYLAFATLMVSLINLYDGGALPERFFGTMRKWYPVGLQFAFGGLFSGFFIFYTRSASLGSSWPFLLFLVALLVGNELLKDRYARMNFQLGAYFIALFSFMIFFVPILVGAMGALPFLFSGVVTLFIMLTFLTALSRFVPRRLEDNKKNLTITIGTIFVTVNALYFLNIIPPIPLSLKDSGVYHHVVRTSAGDYQVTEEVKRWRDYFRLFPRVHISASEPLYFYSAVFAPTRIDTKVNHCWDYFNEEKARWINSHCVEYPIFGGNDGGYRGYSIKRNLWPGLWRVDVETSRGQVIGREKFHIIEGAPPKGTRSETLTRS